MLAAAPDRNAVQLESEDWMLGGHAVKQESASESEPVSRKAIISLDSTSQDAERLFRETIVSIDSVPAIRYRAYRRSTMSAISTVRTR